MPLIGVASKNACACDAHEPYQNDSKHNVASFSMVLTFLLLMILSDASTSRSDNFRADNQRQQMMIDS